MIALALTLAALSATEADRFLATPPARVLVVVLAPPGALLHRSSAELLGAADRVFRATAHVAVVSREQVGLAASDFDACPVEIRSSCWVKTALRSGDATLRGLVILSIQPHANGENVALVSFDLQAAGRELASTDRDEEAIEQAIWTLATKSPNQDIRAGEVEAYLADRARAELGDLLRKIAPGDAFGRIAIAHLEPGTQLDLDGRTLGIAAQNEAELEAVQPGLHRLTLTRANEPKQTIEVDVTARAIARVDATTPSSSSWQTIAVAGGGGTAALGASLLVAGLLSAPELVCVHRGNDAACDASPELAPGPGGVAMPTGSERAAPTLVVIGAGLAAAGATWAIGTAFLEAEDSPWWIVAGSITLGFAAAGASALIAR